MLSHPLHAASLMLVKTQWIANYEIYLKRMIKGVDVRSCSHSSRVDSVLLPIKPLYFDKFLDKVFETI